MERGKEVRMDGEEGRVDGEGRGVVRRRGWMERRRR